MKTPDSIQHHLKTILDHFQDEDQDVRQRQIKTWRLLKYYWSGITNVWYSETAHDWRVYEDEQLALDSQQGYYDKPINVFKAYLESIIAALSITVPGVVCLPDDAENPDDVDTARAGNRIAELVGQHNDVALLWVHALFIYCTEGLVFAHHYTKEDKEYGTYTEDKYENITTEVYKCDACGAELEDDLFTSQVKDEFGPDEDDVELQDAVTKGPICPHCAAELDPELQKTPLIVTRLVGKIEKPKARQCIDVYGGLNVKVANYARKPKDTPYLLFAYDAHYTNVLERYPHLRDNLKGLSGLNQGTDGTNDSYERWGRISPQYRGDYPSNTVTVRNIWLRPSAFNVLSSDDCDELKRKYPDGCRVVFVNDVFAEAENCSLDDEWTMAVDPLSDYLYMDPLGLALTSVQDITNDLVSLIVQTIEHGIPQTFADPDVLNFDAYRQSESLPGSIFPAKARTGKSVSEGFYEVRTASLSGEVLPFTERIQQFGQLVSGALPSLFGGQSSNASSQTAAEYAMSRAQATQRLQTQWKTLSLWWKNVFGKVIPAYIKNVVEDEQFTRKDFSGQYIKVLIRKIELQGKLGSIELESADQLPTSWAQKKDVIMQLLQAGNPEILAALGSPENVNLITQAIGLHNFVMPGQADRDKQYEEIQLLVNSEPIDEMTPSVEIDPLLDNHAIEAGICRNWLMSDSGRLAKTENPMGYQNVLLHLKQHMSIIAPPMNAMPQPNGDAANAGHPSNQHLAAPPTKEMPNAADGNSGQY